MKTILIAHNYSQESYAAMSYNLAHYFANRGFRVIFISHSRVESTPMFLHKKNGGKLIVYQWPGNKRPTDLKSLLWFCKIFFKFRPFVVIGHFVGSNISILVSKILSFGKTHTLEYYHTISDANAMDSKQNNLKKIMLHQRKKLFYKFFCDLIICPSELAKSDLKQVFKIQKSVVILNPMNDRYENDSSINDIDNEIIFSYLGRLDPCKNLVELISGFNTVREKYNSLNLILKIAGSGQLNEKIENLSNGNNIIFYGPLKYKEVDKYIRSSHFVIIPSKFDNLPTVGLESIMNAVPVILSNQTGLANYFSDSINGYIFEPTEEGVVKVLEKAINCKDRYAELSHNARSLFFELFSMKDYFEKMSLLIDNFDR
jgi:glycosyltransferase involved in cell wall biosynthesis